MIGRILRFLTVRRKPKLRAGDEAPLKNYALTLAQEWGEHWNTPIQERLGAAYPHLNREELDRLNALARAAMKHGHDLVYSMAEEQGKDVDNAQWRASVLARYPWIDERNLRHLFSTGMYYAWKDGVS